MKQILLARGQAHDKMAKDIKLASETLPTIQLSSRRGPHDKVDKLKIILDNFVKFIPCQSVTQQDLEEMNETQKITEWNTQAEQVKHRPHPVHCDMRHEYAAPRLDQGTNFQIFGTPGYNGSFQKRKHPGSSPIRKPRHTQSDATSPDTVLAPVGARNETV